AVRLDEVTAINGREKLYVIIGAEKALVAIETDAEFSSYVAEELQHLGAIDQIAAVMRVVHAHPYANRRRRQAVDRFHPWHGLTLTLTLFQRERAFVLLLIADCYFCVCQKWPPSPSSY